MPISYTKDFLEVFEKSITLCISFDNIRLTPEHALYSMTSNKYFSDAFKKFGGNIEYLKMNLIEYFETVEKFKSEEEKEEFINMIPHYSCPSSYQFTLIINNIINKHSGPDVVIGIVDFLTELINITDSYARFFLSEEIDVFNFVKELNKNPNKSEREDKALLVEIFKNLDLKVKEEFGVSLDADDFDELENSEKTESNPSSKNKQLEALALTCINEIVTVNNEPFIGRQEELDKTIQTLCKVKKNNPVHVGDPGVGKTAIIYGLAKMINDKKVPKKLENCQIYSLNVGGLLAGCMYRGQFEQKLKDVLNFVGKDNNSILYIDEIHNIVGAGAGGESTLDASNILKPYLTDGSIKFIGATTFDEYKKYFSKDKALERRFQPIEVKEPTEDETIEILNGIKNYYEEAHNVKYSEEAIKECVSLSVKHIHDRFLPDKAIDLLDGSGAYIISHNMKNKTVTPKIIEKLISKYYGIPEKTVEKKEYSVLASIESNMEKKVFGQNEAIKSIAVAIKRSRAGLSDVNRPIANLLFVGPTGVGKTEVARTIADEMGMELIRFDMSEYSEKHTVSKLIGAPAGYVGYDEGGLLTDAVRRNPNSVVLLDEIEKAHPEIFNILLQVMSNATLTDNKGRKADFKNSILIMTSNAGASEIGKKSLGFGSRITTDSVVTESVNKTFAPEFRNRLTKVVVFNPLDDNMAEKVINKQLGILNSKLKEKDIKVSLDKSAKDYILSSARKEYGAREIIRIIENDIEMVLVEEVIFSKIPKTGKITFSHDGVKFTIKNKAD